MTVSPADTLEDLQCDGYHILQPREGFRFGHDSVLLAHFCRIKPGWRVADFGCGSGVIPLLLCAHTRVGYVDAYELQPELAEYARRNVALNGLGERVCVHQSDVRVLKVEPPYDAVVTNPPYLKCDARMESANEMQRIARFEVSLTLEDLARACARNLRNGGRLYMVYTADRLAELMYTLHGHGLEPKRLQLVQGAADAGPSLALMEAVRGGRPGLQVLDNCIMN